MESKTDDGQQYASYLRMEGGTTNGSAG